MKAQHATPQPSLRPQDELVLDPAIVRWQADIERYSAKIPGLRSPKPARRRRAQQKLSDMLATKYTTKAPADVAIDDLTLWSEATCVRLRRYRPSRAGSNDSGSSPTQLFLHGGGFVSGSAHELVNDRILAHRADQTGIQIFSLSYRLAPEHPYPAAVSDTITALHLLEEHASSLGVDTTRLGLAGNSAVATIAASAALRWRHESGPKLRHLALEVPATTLQPVGDSAERYGVGYGLDDAETLAEQYLPDGIDIDGYSSPLDYPNLKGHPPTLIMTAEHDPLRDGGELYAARLDGAGVPVILLRGEGHVHASSTLTATLPTAELWQVRCTEALRAAYATPRETEHDDAS